MRNLTTYLTLLSGVFFLFSCSLEDHTVNPQYDVYVSGYDATDQRFIAKYWRNGNPVELETSPGPVVTTGVAVSGNDVHVVGVLGQGDGAVGRYWKNGTSLGSWTNFTPARLNDVAVSGDEAYMPGHYENSSQHAVAAYWKNNVAMPLDDGENGQAFGVSLSGNDVYISGTKFNDHVNVARYWKNGMFHDLSDGVHQAIALAIAVSGSDVYVVGYGDDQNNHQAAKYWKNGVEINLTDGTNQAIASDVAVQGNDVYISGSETMNGQNYARVWKNGVPFKLTDDFYFQSIAVPDENIFTAGANWGSNGLVTAKYWKNDTPFFLPGNEGNNHTTSIFVVKH